MRYERASVRRGAVKLCQPVTTHSWGRALARQGYRSAVSHEMRRVLMLHGKSPLLRQRQPCLLGEGAVTVSIISISGHSVCWDDLPRHRGSWAKGKTSFPGESFIERICKESSIHSHCRALPLQPAVTLPYLRRALEYKKSFKTDGEQSGLF